MNFQDFIQNYVKAMTVQYAGFQGRTLRSEFWLFQLAYFLLSLIVGFVDGLLGVGGILSLIFILGHLVPCLAIGARRLHDTDRSGWWQLISLIPLIGFIVLIVFWCQKGTVGPNRFQITN